MNRWIAFFVFALCLQAQTARNLRIERRAPPLPDQRERWALVVGVSSYKYVPPHAQLKYAHRDAEEFARLLRSDEGGGFPGANIRVLTQDAATLGGIRASIHTWLPGSAGPNDVVYIFFAGHAVADDRGDAYFVAHDTDPQNLHATGVSFAEVNDVLTNRIRAGTVVLFADACHAGGIGWTSDPASAPVAAQRSLEALGARDRSFLKLLAARPSEQSFEDERWGGGHGVFTHTVLNALRGAAERERDGFVRASELIDYVSRVVPEQTGSRQNPRVAGNFEAGMALAAVPADLQRESAPAVLRLKGTPNSVIYLDQQFRGVVRPGGELLIETSDGEHSLSIDLPGGGAFEQRLVLTAGANVLDLHTSPGFVLLRLQASIRAGKVLGAGGALAQYRAGKTTSPAATALIMAALEDTGMECVSDYVQSTTNGLKRAMFLRSAEAFGELAKLRPGDKSVEARALFCRARAHIAANEFAEGVELLTESLKLEPDFACSYNALGVGLGRLGKAAEARAAFEKAAKLTPAWALPFLQIAQQHVNRGDLRGAVSYLEKAAKLNPKAIGTYWSLARVHRLLGNTKDFLRVVEETIAIDRNYAPIYAEMGLFHEKAGDASRAAQAYDTYLVLAPNFTDSGEVRKRLQSIRPATVSPPKRAPTLLRDGEKRRG